MPRIEPLETPDTDAADEDAKRVPVKLWLPEPVAVWLASEAQRRYKPRGRYVSDMLIDLYRKANA